MIAILERHFPVLVAATLASLVACCHYAGFFTN
jgi:hypothetical protein